MEQYLHHNYKYTCLISEACKRLKLSSISCYTACYLYHNFNEKTAGQAFLWMKVSSEYKSVFAVTSIYLASKLAEEPTKIRDIVNVSSRILHPDDDPLNIGERYWSLRDSVLNLFTELPEFFEALGTPTTVGKGKCFPNGLESTTGFLPFTC